MSDAAQAGAADTTQTPNPQTPNLEPDFEGEYDAERAKRTIGTLREAERKLKAQLADLQLKAQELDALKEAQKTELERLTEQLNAERAQTGPLKNENLRLRVAIAKALPAELADRLRGETEEDLQADADKLLALVPAPSPGVPRASSRQGAPESSKPGGDDPLLHSLKAKLGIQ